MGRYCLYFLAFALFALLSFESVFAEELSFSNFRVLDPVLTPGNFSTSTNFRVFGNVIQIAIGTSTATNFNLSGGFLYFPFISTSTVGAVALDGKVGLYWSSATGGLEWTIGGYNIGRSTISGGPYTYDSIGNVTTAATSSLLNNLTNGNTYYFVVRAEDVFGNSVATSSEVSATPTVNRYNTYIQTLATTQATTTTLLNPNGTKILCDIPANVLSSGVNLNTTFYSISKDAVVSSKPLPSSKLGASTFYELSFVKQSDLTEVSSFDKPISITFNYTDSDISGIDESTLIPYRWNGSSWVAISGSSVDTSANTVTFSTSNFSNFALLGSAPAAAAPAPSPAPTASVSSGGGGGGGGGGFGFSAPTISQKVTLNGRAYPGANVTIFKDGAVANTLRADINGIWKTDIPVIGGFYTFSVYATDSINTRSLTSSFTLTVQSGQSMTISDIVIPPTISADKSQVKFGNDIKFFGYSFPDSSINVIINSEEQITNETKAGKNGFWDYVLASNLLEKGDHTTRTQTITPDGTKSPFSESIAFRVGDIDAPFKRTAQKIVGKIAPTISGACNKNGDINNDKKINLIDFSIMLFFWNQRNPLNACADINGDKTVNLFDFSILLYYWTG